jgi:ubiquinone/menaquinone biosynthesis C-methylase UbiE
MLNVNRANCSLKSSNNFKPSIPISVKLLVYTAEANTDGENISSVKSYLDQNMAAAVENGWWMKGLYEETMGDRTRILREFQEERRVSILVSCRTISEGVDLKNANCMMPWDASKSPIDNIQRIGRVLRLYKNREGNLCPEDAQLPSTVFIPVFLEMSKFETCGGDRQCIHDVLEKEIELNDNGNFVPFTTVCAALKDELADEDEDLFNELINMPPKPKHTRNAVECLAKHLRKSVDEVIDEMCGCGGGGDFVETVRSNDWDDDEAAAMFDLLAMSQGVALVVDDGENRVRYGDGEACVVLKKNDKDDGYKVVKDNKATHDKKALERVSNRTRVGFSCGFTILFGLDDVDEELVTQEKNFIATKLSVTVQPDANWEKNRQKRNSFFESNGREPSHHTSNKEYRSIGNWIGNQRNEKKKFDKGEKAYITQERIDILNDPEQTPGWKWEIDFEGHWVETHQKRNSFFKTNGREPSNHASNKEERSIAKWISSQRNEKRKFDKGDKALITQERIDILTDTEQTPGWKWNQLEEMWVEKQQKRNLFFKSNGREPITNTKNPDGSYNEEESSIVQWISTQRIEKKKFDKGDNTSMTKERIDILNDPEQTPGWKWEANDLEGMWVENQQKRNSFFKTNGREPSHHASNKDECFIGSWISTQRIAKKKFDKGEKALITQERIDILTDTEQTPGWKWENDLQGQWVENQQNRNSFFKTNGREPSRFTKNPDETPNIEERSIATWINTQRVQKRKFDKGDKALITQERIDILNDPVQTPGWKWVASKKRTEPRNAELLESDMDHASAAIIPTVTPMAAVEPQKTIKRKPKRKVPLQIEKTYRNCSHQTSSKLTDFHRRFKSMKSTNYNATNVSREDFDAYHQEADKYDARDAEEIQSCVNIERLLLERKPKCNRKTYHAIDLGCGMNRFRHRESVQKMSWEALDIHAVDETVTVGNIGDMTELYEDEEFDVVIANRVLWGTDHDAMLSEIHRIMKTGGVVVFCEAVGRWIKKSEDKKTNILSNEIERCGMKIVKQEGTDICEDGTHDLWQYIVATKH